jgi:DNA-damage-inducible protein J
MATFRLLVGGNIFLQSLIPLKLQRLITSQFPHCQLPSSHCIAFVRKKVYIIDEVIVMAKTASLNIRIDPETKISVDRLFSSFGITVTDAVNIFLRKSLMVGGLPFDMTLPKYNDETLAAIQETRDIVSGKIVTKGYSSVEELSAELDAEYEREYGTE